MHAMSHTNSECTVAQRIVALGDALVKPKLSPVAEAEPVTLPALS